LNGLRPTACDELLTKNRQLGAQAPEQHYELDLGLDCFTFRPGHLPHSPGAGRSSDSNPVERAAEKDDAKGILFIGAPIGIEG
jgi:hypothetical protein